MLSVNRLGMAALALALAAATVAGCGGERGPTAGESGRTVEESGPGVKKELAPSTSDTVVRPSQRVIIGSAFIPFDVPFARVAQVSDAIVVSRVVSAEVNYETGIIGHPHPADDGPPPGHPKAQSQATPDPNDPSTGIPFTHYSVEVQRVIRAPGVRVGDSLDISQQGALIDGVAYEIQDDPIILPGVTYLFFLREARLRTFTSQPFGRFEVDAGGRLQAVDRRWEFAPTGIALRGLTISEAEAMIQAAIEEGYAQP